MTTGETIKQRRKELGYSAEYVAEKAGVSAATMYRYENGDIAKIPSDTLRKIAGVLNVQSGYFFDDNDGFTATYNIPELNSAAHDFAPQRTQRMIEITNYTDCLNVEGQEKVLEYVKDLYSSDKYKIREVRMKGEPDE